MKFFRNQPKGVEEELVNKPIREADSFAKRFKEDVKVALFSAPAIVAVYASLVYLTSRFGGALDVESVRTAIFDPTKNLAGDENLFTKIGAYTMSWQYALAVWGVGSFANSILYVLTKTFNKAKQVMGRVFPFMKS